MIDRLLALEPGVSAMAERRVTSRPGGFPQVCLVECVAQLAGIISGHEQGEGGFLAAIDHAEFDGMVRSGDTLIITARTLKSFGRFVLIEGEVVCEGVVLVRTRLTLGIGRL